MVILDYPPDRLLNMISTGALIWTSVRPLIRTSVPTYSKVYDSVGVDLPILFFFSFLNVGAGFALTKADLFPTEAARGAAQIAMVRKRAKIGTGLPVPCCPTSMSCASGG